MEEFLTACAIFVLVMATYALFGLLLGYGIVMLVAL